MIGTCIAASGLKLPSPTTARWLLGTDSEVSIADSAVTVSVGGRRKPEPHVQMTPRGARFGECWGGEVPRHVFGGSLAKIFRWRRVQHQVGGVVGWGGGSWAEQCSSSKTCLKSRPRLHASYFGPNMPSEPYKNRRIQVLSLSGHVFTCVLRPLFRIEDLAEKL